MKTDEIIRMLRYRAEGETSAEETKQLLTEAADRLEELDERVAIMSEGKIGKWLPCKASIYPYGYDVKCSECGLQMGSTFGYHFCPNCGVKMEDAEHDRREGKTDRAD